MKHEVHEPHEWSRGGGYFAKTKVMIITNRGEDTFPVSLWVRLIGPSVAHKPRARYPAVDVVRRSRQTY